MPSSRSPHPSGRPAFAIRIGPDFDVMNYVRRWGAARRALSVAHGDEEVDGTPWLVIKAQGARRLSSSAIFDGGG